MTSKSPTMSIGVSHSLIKETTYKNDGDGKPTNVVEKEEFKAVPHGPGKVISLGATDLETAMKELAGWLAKYSPEVTATEVQPESEQGAKAASHEDTQETKHEATSVKKKFKK